DAIVVVMSDGVDGDLDVEGMGCHGGDGRPAPGGLFLWLGGDVEQKIVRAHQCRAAGRRHQRCRDVHPWPMKKLHAPTPFRNPLTRRASRQNVFVSRLTTTSYQVQTRKYHLEDIP